ncbi:hypothetical protein ACOMHN_061653 [Nucella lapillus]
MKPTDAPDLQETGNTSEQKKSEQSQQHLKEAKQFAKVEVNSDVSTEKTKTEKKENRQKASEMLKIMHQWCLIPVKKKSYGQDVSHMLYPLQDLHKVVFLPASQDPSNARLWTILEKLPLPFLSYCGPSKIASELVASTCHPRALLHALVSCTDHLSESREYGRVILNYFSNNLDVLEESSADKTKLKNELRHLPVYPAFDEKLVSVKESVPVVCLKSSVPQTGLSQWTQEKKDPLVLLCADSVPPKLMAYLGFDEVYDAKFYAQYLLPSIDGLPRPAIFKHMDFIRERFLMGVYTWKMMDKDRRQLCYQLKVTAFIEVNGTLHKAQDFYSPRDAVFKAMCPERFPPKPYDSLK